jgi:hypothetical protein
MRKSDIIKIFVSVVLVLLLLLLLHGLAADFQPKITLFIEMLDQHNEDLFIVQKKFLEAQSLADKTYDEVMLRPREPYVNLSDLERAYITACMFSFTFLFLALVR